MRPSRYFLGLIVALQICVAAVAAGVPWRYFPDGDVPSWVPWNSPGYWTTLIVSLYFWCKADAKEQRVTPSVGTFIAVPLLFPIGVPYYYLRFYPARRALLRLGFAMGFVALCIVAFWLGHIAAYRYYAVWTNHSPPVGQQADSYAGAYLYPEESDPPPRSEYPIISHSNRRPFLRQQTRRRSA